MAASTLNGKRHLSFQSPLLTASFDEMQNFLSWAIVGGGFTEGQQVSWYQVKDDELTEKLDAREFLFQKLKQNGFDKSLGLLTSSLLEDFCQVTVEKNNVSVWGTLPNAVAR